MVKWLADNWFNIVTTFLGGGVWFSGYSIYKSAQIHKEEVKASRVANLLAITANHRETENVYLTCPSVARVKDPLADTNRKPVTISEQIYVNIKIQHLNSVYYAMNDKLVVTVEGVRRDVAQFLALPIPLEVWKKIKVFQNDDFVAFVESCRNWK